MNTVNKFVCTRCGQEYDLEITKVHVKELTFHETGVAQVGKGHRTFKPDFPDNTIRQLNELQAKRIESLEEMRVMDAERIKELEDKIKSISSLLDNE